MTPIPSRAKSLLMLDELHRLGFEQLRFACLGGHTHIYAARDEVNPNHRDLRFAPAVRRFTTPMFDAAPAGEEHLASKWDELFRSDLKPNHLAGMFVLDFPDIARSGFGPDAEYREWFRELRPRLKKGDLPITHPQDQFGAPHPLLEWQTISGAAGRALSQMGAPPNPYLESYEPEPARRTAKDDERGAQHSAARALLMLNELHRFGFEQLRFESHGGHGFVRIYAAQDEVPPDYRDERFTPASRYFENWMTTGSLRGSEHLRVKWGRLLGGPLHPNHLAGMFLLDFPQIARFGFGADEPYRKWFKALHPLIQQGQWPITHGHLSHAAQLPYLDWFSEHGALQVRYPAAPENPFLAKLEEYAP